MEKTLKKILYSLSIFYVIFGIGSIVVTGSPTWITNAFGFGPDPITGEGTECFERGDCNLFERPFDAMIEPYSATLGDFTLVAIWAVIMGILWLRVSNTMMVGVIGVALAALFTQGFSETAQTIGYALLAIAVAIAIYQLLIVRVHFPTN